MVLVNGTQLFPTARKHVGNANCQKIVDGKCRDIQIRNIPDLGITGTINSNPGCNSSVMSCPKTLEWEDRGSSSIFNTCKQVRNEGGQDNKGATWQAGTQNNNGAARMRKCRRVGGAFSIQFPVASVCGVRWILNQLDLLTDKTCVQSSSSQACEDDLSQYNSISGGAPVTDAPTQYKNEFKLPLTYPTIGSDDAILNQFAQGDQHQYLTCDPELWNLNVLSSDLGDVSGIILLMKNVADIVLPHFSKLETSNVNKIDDLFATGFWLQSYGFINTDINGKIKNTYNGLVENQYPGGIIFIEKFKKSFELGSKIVYYNVFLQRFLDNAESYFLNTNDILNDDIYPSIKKSIREACSIGNSDGLRICSIFFKKICASVEKPDLTGENASFARYACSCNMNAAQYHVASPQAEQVVACDNTCLINSDNFPEIINIDGVWQKDTCTSTICVISDVDINIVDSSIGNGIEIANLCGTACTDGGCICYMDNIHVSVVNSDVRGGISVFQECGTCYEVQDGDYDNVREVSCNSGELISKSSTEITQFATWVSDNRYWLFI
mgnify:CR=1 FL=1